MDTIRKIRSSMEMNIIGAIVFLLLLLSLLVSAQGFFSFSTAFEKEYSTSTYHMADTATRLINADNLDAYLAGEKQEEYLKTKGFLDTYCKTMSVSLIYVIKADQSDYGRFTAIFNAVDNDVDNSSYEAWELGYKRDTTNEEYRQKYRKLYEKQSLYETVYRKKTTDGQHPHITTLVPVKDSSGEVAAVLCIQRPMRELSDARRPYLISIGLSTFLLAVFSAVFTVFYLRRQFVAPIRRVSSEADRFARENSKGEPLGQISRFEEIDKLSRSIEKMETDIVQYVENITAFTAEKERIGAELSLASRIQNNSIPDEFPAFPDRKEFDLYATMTPAKEVGGDFYNFYLMDEDHLAFVIGDVSGKGVPAALFMMVTNIVVNNRTMMGGTPGEILTFVNDAICEHNKADMFVTVWLGILEISSGRVLVSNAGHEDAAICRRDGNFELFKTKRSLPVGAMEGVKYRDIELCLEKGDRLFLYTDGVPEASDKDDNMFTLDRMLQALNSAKHKNPRGILESVHESVNAFVGDAPQFDDLTMLCLELKETDG